MQFDIKANTEHDMKTGRCWGSIARLAPGCGIIACVFAQVAMFRHLQTDASTVGRALAGALTATLCGALCQNLFYGRSRTQETSFSEGIPVQGVLSLNPRPNPGLVETQLLSIVNQNRRAKAA